MEIAGFISDIDDQTLKFRLLGTMIQKYIEDETLNQLWEVFRLTTLYEKFQKPEMEKYAEEAAKNSRKNTMLNLVQKNFERGQTDKDIMLALDLTKQELEEYKAELKIQ